MAFEQVPPALVAELHGSLRRAGNVGEQNGGERSVGLARTSNAGEELFDLLHDRGHVAYPRPVIRAIKLHQACAGDVLGEVAAVADLDHPVSAPVEDQSRCADRAQRATDIYLRVHPQQRNGGPGAGREPLEAGPRLP